MNKEKKNCKTVKIAIKAAYHFDLNVLKIRTKGFCINIIKKKVLQTS